MTIAGWLDDDLGGWLSDEHRERLRREDAAERVAAERERIDRETAADDRLDALTFAAKKSGRPEPGRTRDEILEAARDAPDDAVPGRLRGDHPGTVDVEYLTQPAASGRPRPEPPEVTAARERRDRRQREQLSAHLRERGFPTVAGFVSAFDTKRPDGGTTSRPRRG